MKAITINDELKGIVNFGGLFVSGLKIDNSGEEFLKEEQIGFHKGALTTLAKEREEMLKILSIVEQLMQMHIKSLQELGIDLQKESQQAKKSKSIEGALR